MQSASRGFSNSYIVLLIEDEDADADALIDALAATKALRVLRVDRLASGLERISAGNIDAVVLDLSLPDAAGLSGLRAVRAAAPWIPVLVFTGNRDEHLAVQVLHHGAQDFLVKGDVDGAQIALRIRDAFERQHYMMRASVIAEEHASLARAEERRASWLSEAGKLFSSSLDYDATLRNIERAIVGQFALACLVELVEPRQTADPVDAEVAKRLQEVIRTGRSWFDEDAANALVVPMTVAGRRIGAIALTFDVKRGPIAMADRLLCEELGHRAALALENAALYQQARAAIALREEFLSIASHELRTPLGTLQLQIQVLQSKLKSTSPPTTAEIGERLVKCLAQTTRVGRLVNTLLDVSLIASGQLQLKAEELEMSVLVRETLERVVSESSFKTTDVVFKDGVSIVGLWDRMRIEQMVTNLVANGLKYGGGTPIEVTLSADGAQAVLVVRDRGIGIAPQDLGRIFGRFERAAAVRHYSGLGLGLYVTQQIVEAHGGTISVESEVGKGSVFTVRLPVQPRTAQ